MILRSYLDMRSATAHNDSRAVARELWDAKSAFNLVVSKSWAAARTIENTGRLLRLFLFLDHAKDLRVFVLRNRELLTSRPLGALGGKIEISLDPP